MNEINSSIRLTCTNGKFSDTFSQQSISINQTAQGATGGLLSVTTSATNLPAGSVSTLGILALQNTDATNFVTGGTTVSGTYVPVIKLKPGESAVVRLMTGITFQLRSDTATTLVNYLLLQD